MTDCGLLIRGLCFFCHCPCRRLLACHFARPTCYFRLHFSIPPRAMSTYPFRPPAAAAAPPWFDRAPGCGAIDPANHVALIVWFGCAESAGAPPRAHQSEAVLRRNIRLTRATMYRLCSRHYHPQNHNTNFTHFEAAACSFAAAGRQGQRPHPTSQSNGG